MDELIRDLYGKPRPDPGAQHRVWRRVTARRRRRRLTWLAIPAALATILLYTTYVSPATPKPVNPGTSESVAPGTSESVASGTSESVAPGTSDLVQGRSILLAAATSAASSATDGTYWHVRKFRDSGGETDLWVTRQGQAWTAEQGRTSRVTGRSPFTMAGRDLTYEQIQALPSDPGALRSRVAAMLPAGSSKGLLADALSGLLWTKPSAPGVRAAAYRALADLPEVRYLGDATDTRGRAGQAFAFDLPSGVSRTLIIDPASSQVLSSTDSDGHAELVLTAGWTDQGPA
ncbi:CU044_5270 family protein [Nonomuraea insulae]|uniref:CU044_5270 family protein n=1 Tax=Nonomuraea insulae TaxID=1616787 RepID=A0ABW1CVY0_9ACTN